MLEMLIIELENLLEDIRTLEDQQKTRETRKEISNYVYLENTSLLKKELSSIQWLIGQLLEEHFEDVSDFSKFREKINQYLDQRQSNANMPGAVRALVNNKLEIIVKYFSGKGNMVK